MLVALLAGACTCGTEEIDKRACSSDLECDPGQYCDLHQAPPTCVDEDHECNPEGAGSTECCPGQICSNDLYMCVDKYVACDPTKTGQCAKKGQVCKNLGSKPSGPGCTWDECGEGVACKDGLSCFNGYCVGEPPCSGGCPAGQACVTATNQCFKIGEQPAFKESCKQTCADGKILVFTDGKNIFNRCRRDYECTCAPLPPVRSSDVARFSSLAVAGDKLLVSAYDGTREADAPHGDLVLHTFDKATLKAEKIEWIDGVPTSGPRTGDPDGPRGGRAGAGPDVGRYTSIAHDAAGGLTHIAYYAVRDGATVLGDLRYAVRKGTDAWRIHTVDGGSGAGENGDAGLYTQISLAPDGFPVIVYFVKAGADGFTTAVKFARAKVREPVKPADWTLTTIATGKRPAPPCAAPACKEGETCVDDGSHPDGICRATARNSDCRPSCGSDEACVMDNGLAVCQTSLRASTLAGLPEGNGLQPAVAYLDQVPVVVWYDRTNKKLKGVIARADSAATGAEFKAGDVVTLDDGVVSGSTIAHDVGQFASVAVGPASVQSRIAVSYMDATSHQLKVLTAKAGWGGIAKFVVDEGRGAPDSDPTVFVGADTSIRFDSQGGLAVLYQDSTGGDLKIARQPAGGSFTLTTLASEGAGGFYASLATDGATLFASHAVIKAASASDSANKIEVVKVP